MKKSLVAAIALTVIAIVGFGLAHTFASHLEDRGLGLDMLMVMTVAATMLLVLMWTLWILFLSNLKLLPRLLTAAGVFLTPFALMMILRPVFGGDANIVRFELFSSHEEPVLEKVEVTTGIDLTTESPDDYPRFLGPNQNAVVSREIEFDVDKFSTPKRFWKQTIGSGWSGFAARNGYAVTMEQRHELECVTCYEIESGELVWSYENPVRHCDEMNFGRVGPRATPTIHEGRVYAVGAVGNFVCLDGKDGSVVWKKNLAEMCDSPVNSFEPKLGGETYFWESESTLNWGRSGSPLIVDDKVIVPGGGSRTGKKTTLFAFDRLTGEVIWSGGDKMISYGSPIFGTLAGQDQILYVAEADVMGFHPVDGRVLWSHPRIGYSDSMANCSQPTIVDDDSFLTSKGYNDGGGELLTLSVADGKFSVKSDWSEHRVLHTKLTSPVVHEGYTYALSNGFMECADLKDGRRVWKRRGRFGHGQLLLVGDKLVVHTEGGVVHLLDATPDGYTELATFKTIDGVCWNTLCLYGDKLLVRSELEAGCYQLPVVSKETVPESSEEVQAE